MEGQTCISLPEEQTGPQGGHATDFFKFFTGIVVDYSIKNDKLELECQDQLYVAKKKVPASNATNTQSLTYFEENPYNIIKKLIRDEGGISRDYIDSSQINTERDLWFDGWQFSRVITNPQTIRTLLDELQEQTHSFIYTDGDKYKVKALAPPIPGTTQYEITDNEIILGSLSLQGQMDDNFCNRCEVYYDYDESGSDNAENYESVAIAENTESQNTTQWNEISERTIKSKWVRSYSWTQPSDITGVTIYHASKGNTDGSGTLFYDQSNTSEDNNQTLEWKAPGQSNYGEAVVIDRDGTYQVFGRKSKRKYIRVVVVYDDLPATDQTDTITLNGISGSVLANSIAHHYVARYSTSPQGEPKFSLPIHSAVYNNDFVKPGDLVKLTTDSLASRSTPEWDEESVFLLSTNFDPAKKRLECSGMQTGFRRKYGFIGASTITNDYDSATTSEKEYAFIADDRDNLGADDEAAYFVW
jgi:hypothetical protein